MDAACDTYVGVFEEDVQLIERVDGNEQVQDEGDAVGALFAEELVAAGEVKNLAAQHQPAVDQMAETEACKNKKKTLIPIKLSTKLIKLQVGLGLDCLIQVYSCLYMFKAV